jgi:hypothetical protein
MWHSPQRRVIVSVGNSTGAIPVPSAAYVPGYVAPLSIQSRTIVRSCGENAAP